MHILIVEDEYGLADAVSEVLKKENFLDFNVISFNLNNRNNNSICLYEL